MREGVPSFHTLSLESFCTFGPPSFFSELHPSLSCMLCKASTFAPTSLFQWFLPMRSVQKVSLVLTIVFIFFSYFFYTRVTLHSLLLTHPPTHPKSAL